MTANNSGLTSLPSLSDIAHFILIWPLYQYQPLISNQLSLRGMGPLSLEH